MNNKKRFTILGAVLGSATILAMPMAHATNQDEQYLSTLGAQGINGQPDAMIGFARSFCDTVGGFGAAANQYGLAASQGLSMMQTAQAGAAAIKSYCPDKMPQVGPMPNILLPGMNGQAS